MPKGHMNDVDPTAPVSEQAAHWWVILNTGPSTPADHREFGDWVARSPERVEAFLQTAQLTKALKSKSLPWPDTQVEELAREVREAGDVARLPHSSDGFLSPPFSRAPRRSRPSTLLLAIAASVLALVAGGWWVLDHAHEYETGVGEQRSVALSDGSIVTLNTASRIEINFEKSHRLIRLVSGEALFQVAKDPARPFDVVVGTATVRAVGTQFNVDKRAVGTTVTVVEGKVAVASSGEKLTFLDAGQQLTVAAAKRTLPLPEPANLAAATAWTQRRLVFERRSLAEVAAEFNRYNEQAIRIESLELRAQEVTGVFQANDPDSFLKFIANVPGARIERDSDSIRVFRSP